MLNSSLVQSDSFATTKALIISDEEKSTKKKNAAISLNKCQMGENPPLMRQKQQKF